MSRNNYYRGSRNGRRGNGPTWGNNSNYQNDYQNDGNYDHRNRSDDYDDREERAYNSYNRSGMGSRQSENYGGNNYGSRSYGNYGTGYGGGTLRNQQDNYYDQYGRENNGHYNNYSYRDDDRGFFERAGDRLERAGDRIRDNWNDWREHQHDNRNDYREHNDHNYSSRHQDDHRNFFERTADKMKEKWNDWNRQHDDYDRDGYQRRDNFSSGNRNSYSQNDHYPETGFNRGRRYYEESQQNSQRSEPRFRNREQEEWSY